VDPASLLVEQLADQQSGEFAGSAESWTPRFSVHDLSKGRILPHKKVRVQFLRCSWERCFGVNSARREYCF
jgi:hypothetical protein